MKELLYALPGGFVSQYSRYGLTPAHMRYRLIPGPHLATMGADGISGGAMFIAAGADAFSGNDALCCRQIVGECRKRHFSRVILDYEGDAAAAVPFARTLSRFCSQHGLTLYLPEPIASPSLHCQVLISSVVTTGTLERRLQAAAETYGRERVVLALEAVAEDFPLPASSPRGTPLGTDALAALIRQLEPAVFFDHGLCAHYFTYMSRSEGAHFVLFDSPHSLRQKLDTARRLSLDSALLAAPQTEGWLEDIFGPQT